MKLSKQRVWLSALFLFLIFFNSSLFAQNQIDSLKQLVDKQNGLELTETLNELSWQYRNRNVDSALLYAKKSVENSVLLSEKGALGTSYNSLASSFEALGKLDSAKYYHSQSLEIKYQTKDSVGIADSYNNLGIVHDELGEYDTSLDYYFKALRLYEDHATSFAKVPMVLSNIGIVYKKQNELDKVLDYYQRALDIYEENNHEFGMVVTKGNIGSLLLNMKEYERSIQLSMEAEELYRKLGYSRYVPYMIINAGIAKDSLKQHVEAQRDYLEAIDLFSKDENMYELANAKICLAENYTFQNQAAKALKEVEEALQITKENDFKEFEVKALRQKALSSASLGQYGEAYESAMLYNKGRDEIYEDEKAKSVLELEAKYENEKKAKEILRQRALVAEKDLEVKRKNYMLYGSIGLAILLGLLGYLLYNQQKLKNRQLKKETELKTALARIETQNRLQEQRLRISRDLHDNIGSQLTFIISSLDNLKYGFPDMKEKLESKLTGISAFTSQTIYELRDTIWAMNKSNITLEDLQSRISNFIDNATKASDQVKFSFNVNEEVDSNNSFSSVAGMNIYRIIQEAVNNSLKYADAGKVDVSLSKSNLAYVFSIRDDGKGFDMDSVELGNGINNLKKRARDIGGEISINSKIEKGTEIVLSLPLE